ncbi:copper chaperone PCu(A)C [Loktanella sp. R86503]|uniref:copper chaperone PCu(A)C n=1 Tax=Loktanella sp. R86503 TaxID=3093847 RepID=UPI0036DD2073
MKLTTIGLFAAMMSATAAQAQMADGTMTHSAQDHSAMDHANGETYTLGDLTITGAFTRATLPNAPVAGGFLTVTNAGTVDDTLIAAASTISGDTQIHEMAMQGDVMKMRELSEGLPIPAGETVTLQPGGYHLMFMDLNYPLIEGEAIAVTLTFENAGQIDVVLPVGATAAKMAH